MTSTLVLLRHGQSLWNLENRFTGWKDVPLSDKGVEEARRAGRLLREEGIAVDVLHTSLLTRAIATANLALEAAGRSWIPVTRHWRLNERHYGALQGLDKKETSERHGADQVFAWRRSYDTRPPALELDDARHPRFDERYASLPPDVLPSSECLADVVARAIPYWHDAITPQLGQGHCVLVVAHGNSLRALVKHLDGIDDDAISELNIPTGIPLVYTIDDSFRAVSSRYLGDPDEAAAAARAVANQAR
jgi:2,3-bisphosphoglycerate-dependent phosphoglycerate mutase